MNRVKIAVIGGVLMTSVNSGNAVAACEAFAGMATTDVLCGVGFCGQLLSSVGTGEVETVLDGGHVADQPLKLMPNGNQKFRTVTTITFSDGEYAGQSLQLEGQGTCTPLDMDNPMVCGLNESSMDNDAGDFLWGKARKIGYIDFRGLPVSNWLIEGTICTSQS